MTDAGKTILTDSVTIPPDLAEVASARRFAAKMATTAGFSEERVFDITVACSEAVANAVEHSPTKGEIQVRAVLHTDRLEIEIQGPGEFQAPSGLKERGNRGLGLPLMAKLSDHLALFSGPQGQTFVSLTFYRPGVDRQSAGPVAPSFANLAEEDRLLDDVLTNFPDGFYVLDDDWRFVYLNPSVLASLKETREEILGQTIWEALPGWTLEERRVLETAKANHATITFERAGETPFGWREWTVFPVEEGIAVISRDITKRRHAETELERSQHALAEAALCTENSLEEARRSLTVQARYLDAFFEHSLTPLVLLDRDFNFIRVNEAYAKQTGRKVEELEGRNHFELFPSDARVIFDEVVRSKQPFRAKARPFDFPEHPEWGTTYWDWTLTPLLGQAGEVEALVFALEDVTGQYSRKRRRRGLPWPTVSWPPARRWVFISTGIGMILEVLLFLGLSFLESPRQYLGIPGPAAVLIGTIVAAIAGTTAGATVTLIGGLAFMGFLGHFGASVSWPTILVSIALWMLVSIVTGYVARQVKQSAASRELLLSQSVRDRDALMDSLRQAEERQRQAAEENERLYRQQLDIAESLQLALLNIPSQIGPVRIGHLYRSATQAARVGGDFYDAFELKDNKTAVLIGDVSGHGIQAARTATFVKDVVHAFAHQSSRPHEVLRRTNDMLVEKELPGFVTLWLGVLDNQTGYLRFASAGHPDTLLKRASGVIQLLGGGSLPLGVFPQTSWRPGIVQVETDDILLLYTDGVIEARRGEELFGEKRLQALLQESHISVEQLPGLILDEALAYSGGILTDDTAVLALEITEATAKGPVGSQQQSLLG